LTITGGTDAVIGSGTTIQVKQAGSSQSGFLSSTDWTTFNSKQDAIINPITGTIATGQVAFGTADGVIGGDSGLFWDNVNKRLGINSTGTAPIDVVANSGFTAIKFKSASTTVGSLLTDNNNIYFSINELSGIRFVLRNGLTDGTRRGAIIHPSQNIRFGVNIDAPTQTLDVRGTGRIRDGVSLADTSGNVQIGTLTDAGFRLDVNGTARVQGALRANPIYLFDGGNPADRYGLGTSTGTTNLFGGNNVLIGVLRDNTTLNTSNANIWFSSNNTRINTVLKIGGDTTDASSILDITSTTKGFLPPRMTTTQKNAIASPATGLVVYDNTLNKLSVFTGATWETVTSL
jgi:hypothetical protein